MLRITQHSAVFDSPAKRSKWHRLRRENTFPKTGSTPSSPPSRPKHIMILLPEVQVHTRKDLFFDDLLLNFISLKLTSHQHPNHRLESHRPSHSNRVSGSYSSYMESRETPSQEQYRATRPQRSHRASGMEPYQGSRTRFRIK